MRRWVWTVVVLAGLVVFGRFCLVVLDEREQAFRTLLNEPEFSAFGVRLNRPSLTTPGIYVRIPFVHQLYRYDRLQRRYDSEPRDVYTKEKQLIEVDYFAIWQIDDPRLFFETNRTYASARQRLDTVTYSEVRQALALHTLADMLSEARGEIMQTIAQKCDEKLQPRGIRIRDLRIRRSDYPEANLARILDRMRSERERFAKKARAEGEEAALEIRSVAERESQVIRAEALRESERIRGAGDASAAGIYGRAYDQDPDFYSFTKSLEAYRVSIDEETTMVLTPRSRFLRYLFRDSKPLTPVSSGSAGSPGPRKGP